jgi:hypothetical protein
LHLSITAPNKHAVMWISHFRQVAGGSRGGLRTSSEDNLDTRLIVVGGLSTESGRRGTRDIDLGVARWGDWSGSRDDCQAGTMWAAI